MTINRKIIYFLLSTVATLILSGCAYNSPVPGVIFTYTTFPSGDKVKLDSETACKQG